MDALKFLIHFDRVLGNSRGRVGVKTGGEGYNVLPN